MRNSCLGITNFLNLLAAIRRRLFSQDHWALPSTATYRRMISSYGLKITTSSDGFSRASDTRLEYAGPRDDSTVTLMASDLARKRVRRAMDSLGHHFENDADLALIHNIVVRSYLEFIAPPGIGLRTCDLSVGDSFLDIGCFRGYLSLKAASLVGPSGLVLAIDPEIDSVELLRHQAKLNNQQQVTVKQAVVVPCGEQQYQTTIFSSGDGSTNTALIDEHLPIRTNTKTVAAYPITSLIKEALDKNESSRRLVLSVTTNGTEMELAKLALNNTDKPLTCTLPFLYTSKTVNNFIEELQETFPNLAIYKSFPWIQIRRD